MLPREAHVTTSTDSHDQPITLDSDPYAWFAYMRQTEPVWRGTIMDTSMSPDTTASFFSTAGWTTSSRRSKL